MTKKSLSLSKGGLALAVFVAYLAFCAFFFTYGIDKMQEVANRLGEEGTFGGIGVAFLLTFALIALVAFAVPEVMFLISFIGNFVNKGKTIGFTVVSLVAEIISIAVLLFLTNFFIAGVEYDILSIVIMGIFDLLVLVSFVHSIIVLVKQKTADEE